MNRILSLCVFVTLVAAAQPAAAGSNPTYSERMVFFGNSCPSGYLPLEGQELSISENQVLFSLLGTAYGGDGQTTFRLPAAKPLFEAGANGNQVLVTQCIANTGDFPPR
jgi:microcystin-dependent protein